MYVQFGFKIQGGIKIFKNLIMFNLRMRESYSDSLGLFILRKEDPSTRKILEARRINFLLGIHAEVLVSVVNSKEGIKDPSLPTE